MHQQIKMEERKMKTINLRSEYPELYHRDMFVEVADEIADLLYDSRKLQHRLNEQDRYNGVAYVVFDDDDSVNVCHAPSPYQELVTEEMIRALYQALFSLPEDQRRRMYLHFIAGVSQTDIAIAEGVRTQSVNDSIYRALYQLRKKLNYFS